MNILIAACGFALSVLVLCAGVVGVVFWVAMRSAPYEPE